MAVEEITKELLNLPIYAQLGLASGFMGYAIAQRDYRKNERNIDVVFGVIMFGLPMGITYALLDDWFSQCKGPATAVAFVLGPFFGLLWAKYGKMNLFNFLLKLGASHETNEGDAWQALHFRKGIAPMEITVTMKDGMKYKCNSVGDYNKCKFAPYTADDDGIAFYVDGYAHEDGDWIEYDGVINSKAGDLVTYLPREEIAKMEMRHIKSE